MASKEMLFVLSLGLRNLLGQIHEIYSDKVSYELLKKHKNIASNISFVDRSKDIDKVTFASYNKVKPFIEEKGYNPLSKDIYKVRRAWLEKRENPIKIGRLANKLLGDIVDQKQIEVFVNRYKTESKKENSGLKWERVHGKDINRWYLYDKYVKGGGTLNRSCLRKPDRNQFLNFLSDNPNSVRLLTLQNENNQLLARALMWKLTEPNGRFYLDRIYSRFDEDVNLFIETAKHNGWLYKSKQTYGGGVPIIDGHTGEIKPIKMVVKNFKNHNFKGYPYMDTFQFFDTKKNILTNDESIFINNDIFKLNKINGSYTSYDDNNNDELDDLFEI